MAAGRELIDGAGFALDYFEARHAETLAPIAPSRTDRCGSWSPPSSATTRLIDNIGV